MKSIITDRKVCFICGTTASLEEHHIFKGAYRKKSERYGLKVWLCHEHHTGKTGVHNNPTLDNRLKRLAEATLREKRPEVDWLNEFGRTWL